MVQVLASMSSSKPNLDPHKCQSTTNCCHPSTSYQVLVSGAKKLSTNSKSDKLESSILSLENYSSRKNSFKTHHHQYREKHNAISSLPQSRENTANKIIPTCSCESDATNETNSLEILLTKDMLAADKSIKGNGSIDPPLDARGVKRKKVCNQFIHSILDQLNQNKTSQNRDETSKSRHHAKRQNTSISASSSTEDNTDGLNDYDLQPDISSSTIILATGKKSWQNLFSRCKSSDKDLMKKRSQNSMSSSSNSKDHSQQFNSARESILPVYNVDNKLNSIEHFIGNDECSCDRVDVTHCNSADLIQLQAKSFQHEQRFDYRRNYHSSGRHSKRLSSSSLPHAPVRKKNYSNKEPTMYDSESVESTISKESEKSMHTSRYMLRAVMWRQIMKKRRDLQGMAFEEELYSSYCKDNEGSALKQSMSAVREEMPNNNGLQNGECDSSLTDYCVRTTVGLPTTIWEEHSKDEQMNLKQVTEEKTFIIDKDKTIGQLMSVIEDVVENQLAQSKKLMTDVTSATGLNVTELTSMLAKSVASCVTNALKKSKKRDCEDIRLFTQPSCKSSESKNSLQTLEPNPQPVQCQPCFLNTLHSIQPPSCCSQGISSRSSSQRSRANCFKVIPCQCDEQQPTKPHAKQPASGKVKSNSKTTHAPQTVDGQSHCSFSALNAKPTVNRMKYIQGSNHILCEHEDQDNGKARCDKLGSTEACTRIRTDKYKEKVPYPEQPVPMHRCLKNQVPTTPTTNDNGKPEKHVAANGSQGNLGLLKHITVIEDSIASGDKQLKVTLDNVILSEKTKEPDYSKATLTSMIRNSLILEQMQARNQENVRDGRKSPRYLRIANNRKKACKPIKLLNAKKMLPNTNKLRRRTCQIADYSKATLASMVRNSLILTQMQERIQENLRAGRKSPRYLRISNSRKKVCKPIKQPYAKKMLPNTNKLQCRTCQIADYSKATLVSMMRSNLIMKQMQARIQKNLRAGRKSPRYLRISNSRKKVCKPIKQPYAKKMLPKMNKLQRRTCQTADYLKASLSSMIWDSLILEQMQDRMQENIRAKRKSSRFLRISNSRKKVCKPIKLPNAKKMLPNMKELRCRTCEIADYSKATLTSMIRNSLILEQMEERFQKNVRAGRKSPRYLRIANSRKKVCKPIKLPIAQKMLPNTKEKLPNAKKMLPNMKELRCRTYEIADYSKATLTSMIRNSLILEQMQKRIQENVRAGRKSPRYLRIANSRKKVRKPIKLTNLKKT